MFYSLTYKNFLFYQWKYLQCAQPAYICIRVSYKPLLLSLKVETSYQWVRIFLFYLLEYTTIEVNEEYSFLTFAKHKNNIYSLKNYTNLHREFKDILVEKLKLMLSFYNQVNAKPLNKPSSVCEPSSPSGPSEPADRGLLHPN